MKLSQVKDRMQENEVLNDQLPNGEMVPSHFHVTEVGAIDKKFIDCGGNLRAEKVINFQLWNANDYDHRIHPEKLLKIIDLSEKALGLDDLEIEVEYQGDTIGKFGLDFFNHSFQLISKQTDCLAKDNCGVKPSKPKVSLAQLGKEKVATESCCAPHSNCC